MLDKNRSLANLCFDLLEIDWEAAENQSYIDETLKKLTDKVDNYAGLKKFTESQVELLKSEKKFIDQRLKALDILLERLKERALFALDTLQTNQLKGELGHTIFRREYRSLIVDDEDQIPEEFITREVKIKVDRKKLKEALESGLDIPGCHLEIQASATIK